MNKDHLWKWNIYENGSFMKADKIWKQQAISGLLISPAIPHSAWFCRLTEIRSTPSGKPLHSLSAFFSFEFSRFSQAAIYLEPDRYGISLFFQKWRSALSSIFYRPASHTLSTLFYSSKKNGLMVFQLYPLLDLCQYFGQKKLKDYATLFSSSSSFCWGVI